MHNLFEAVDFDVFARACNEEVCEPPVVMRARTKLRGTYLLLFKRPNKTSIK